MVGGHDSGQNKVFGDSSTSSVMLLQVHDKKQGCNSARESDIFRCPQSFLLSKKAKTNVKIILFNSIPISVGHVNSK